MNKPKTLLFSVTAKDCDWQYMRGTGPGGQKRNKTESKVRCTHRESGAVGESDETRDQHQNKRIAFRKMAESTKFRTWHKLEVARRTGSQIDLEEWIEKTMREENLRIEGKVDGKWVPISKAKEENESSN